MNSLLNSIRCHIDYPDNYEDGDIRSFVKDFLYKEGDIWEMRKCIHEELIKWAALYIHIEGCPEYLALEIATDLLSIDTNEQRLITAIYDVAHTLDENEDMVEFDV
jgi:hypothetical protein